MPVLILAIASFSAFVAIVILLLIADTLESQTIRHRKNLALENPPPLLSISDAFDPIYSVLWEAPVAAFRRIESGGMSGVPAARLRPIYEEAAARFPEIYDGCCFIAWLQFLENTRMISWNGAHLVLTAEGKAFLKFRFVTDALVDV